MSWRINCSVLSNITDIWKRISSRKLSWSIRRTPWQILSSTSSLVWSDVLMRWKVPRPKTVLLKLHDVWEEPEKRKEEMIFLKSLQLPQQDLREPEKLQSSERSPLIEDRQFKAKSWRSYFMKKKQSGNTKGPAASWEWTDWTWKSSSFRWGTWDVSGRDADVYQYVWCLKGNLKYSVFLSLASSGSSEGRGKEHFQVGTNIPFWIVFSLLICI